MTGPVLQQHTENSGKNDRQSKRWLWFVVAFLVVMGPVGVFLGAVGLVVWLCVRAAKAKESGRPGPSRPMAPPTGRKETAAEDRADVGTAPGFFRDVFTDDPGTGAAEKAARKDNFRIQAGDSHSRKKRLEQLEVMRDAGLYTAEQYRERKAQIIRETEPD